MKKANTCLIFLFTLSIILNGCGKDRDLQDYKNDLLADSIAKLQAFKGSYSGYVTSKRDGLNMGAMRITLIPKTKVIGGSDQSGSTAQAVLAVNVEFQGLSKMAIAAQDSFVDDDKGSFQTDIIVKVKNSQGNFEDKTVTITGIVNGESLVGELQAIDYPDYSAKINLIKQDTSLEVLAEKVKPSNGGFSHGSYIGKTKFTSGTIKNVIMVLLKPNTTSEADFYNLFAPVKPVQVTLNYGQDAQLNFTNGNWDQRTGKLTGQTKLSQVLVSPNGTTTTQNADFSLSCEMANGNGFGCEITASNAVGKVASIDLVPNKTGQTDVEDNQNNRSPITKSYHGILKLTSGNVDSVLAAIYPARTRLEEITNLYFPRTEVNIVVNLSFRGVGITFSNVKFDTVRGSLDATQNMISDGLTATLTLTCQNFHFVDKNYSFSCLYHSSLGNTDAQFIFSSKQ